MIAGLPMYERPENMAAHDRYWQLIRTALADHDIAAPENLTRAHDVWAMWTHPDLTLSQTCGLPYRAKLHSQVALIGTPDFGLPDTARGYYFSEIIVRNDDLRETLGAFSDATFAYNDALSQSGWAAVCSAGAVFRQRICTGGHRASAHAVADGRADIAALDAVTWRDLQRYEPTLCRKLRSLGRTDPTPGLPYIAAPGADVAAKARAVAAAIDSLNAADRDVLGIVGLATIASADYLALPLPAVA